MSTRNYFTYLFPLQHFYFILFTKIFNWRDLLSGTTTSWDWGYPIRRGEFLDYYDAVVVVFWKFWSMVMVYFRGRGGGHRSAGRGTHTFGHNLPNHLHNFPQKQPPATCLPLPSLMHWLWASFCISLRKKWRKFDTKTNKNSDGDGTIERVCVIRT